MLNFVKSNAWAISKLITWLWFISLQVKLENLLILMCFERLRNVKENVKKYEFYCTTQFLFKPLRHNQFNTIDFIKK